MNKIIDPKLECEKIIEFITSKNKLLGTVGGVVGISGGIDSTICAALIVKALGPSNCLGIIIPAPDSNPQDAEDANKVAEFLGIKTIYHPLNLAEFEFEDRDFEKEIKPLLLSMNKLLPPQIELPYIMKLRGRMNIITYYARKNNYFQCQTLEKTEWMLGWFDKFGDGAGDIAPIFHSYKTEVRELAKRIGVPDFILNRSPTSGNYPLTDEEELGMSLEEADIILKKLDKGIVEENRNFKKIERMVSISKSKREIPLWIN